MSLPTPDDLGRSPAWENYVVAQAVQASLGLIPEHTLALGVEVAGTDVRLRFQLAEAAEDDVADVDDIVSELESLVGPGVQVEGIYEVRTERRVTSSGEIRWIFLARV